MIYTNSNDLNLYLKQENEQSLTFKLIENTLNKNNQRVKPKKHITFFLII